MLQRIAVPLHPELGNRPEDRVPMSRLRARIAERLLQSQTSTASLTHVQRSQHAAGNRPAQPLQGQIRG